MDIAALSLPLGSTWLPRADENALSRRNSRALPRRTFDLAVLLQLGRVLLEALVRLAALCDLLKELVVALEKLLMHPRLLLNLLLCGEPLLIGGRRPLPSHDLWLDELLAEEFDRTGDDLNDDDKRELAQVLHSMRIE